VGIGAKVKGAVVDDRAGSEEGRVLVLDRELERYVRFVILKVNVVFRGVLLDEVVLQEKGLFLVRGEDEVHRVDRLRQRPRLDVLHVVAKVTADTVVEVPGLAYVNDPAVAVLEEVDAR